MTTSGSSPSTVVPVVMKIGRMRLSTLATTACRGAWPLAINWIEWCTIRIALLTEVPIRMTKPNMVRMSSVWVVKRFIRPRQMTPPTAASGTDRMTTSG